MKVYVVDHTYDGEDPKNCSWGFLVDMFSQCSPEISYLTSPPDDNPDCLDASTVFFVHVSGNEQDWREKACKSDSHIVLLRSAGRQHENPNTRGTLHGCHWSPHEFRDPSNARVQKLISQIVCGDNVDWELLHPDPVEPLLAARLIVEANAFSGKPSSDVMINKIPAPLFQAAKLVVDADTTDTANLLRLIEKFEKALAS